jgi:exodeoxyribonuclease VII large subunit
VDFTISDFVADLRAPTPSAAAEIISGHWVDAGSRLKEIQIRLKNAMLRDLNHRKTLLSHIQARVISPKDRLREQIQRTDELSHRLQRSMKIRLERKKTLLEHGMAKLDALSPLRVLERGYTLVRDPLHGSVIKSTNQVTSGQELQITFYDGQRSVRAV